MAAALLTALGLPPAIRVAAIEHLYSMALLLDPIAVEKEGRSLPDLLGELAKARNSAGAGVPWRVVSLGPAPSGGGDDVAARVVDADGPLEGAAVYFHRAPHSGCSAKSDASGVAACRLIDTHGDDDDHDAHAVSVVATYPGDVRSDRVLAPTTRVLPKP